MKKTMRILAIMLIAIFMVSFSAGFAAERKNLSILKKTVRGSGEIELLLYADLGEQPNTGNITVDSDGTALSINTIYPYTNLQYGISWIVLVDVSSVATDHTKAPVKGMINGIWELVNKDRDNMYVIKSGTATNDIPSKIVTSDDRRDQLKDELTHEPSNEKLYSTLRDVLNYVSANRSSFKTNINVVILSDGLTPVDDAENAYVNLIAQTGAFVYPVIFSNEADDGRFDTYKAMADISKVGIAIKDTEKGERDPDDEKRPTAVDKIRKNESNLYQVIVDPRVGGFIGTKLTVTAKANGQIFYDEVMLADWEIENIKNAFAVPTPEPTITTEPTTTPGSTGEIIIDDIKWIDKTVFLGLTVLDLLIIGGATIAGIALVLIIVLLLVNRAKKNSIYTPAPPMPVYDRSAGGPPENPLDGGGDEPTHRPTRPVFGGSETRPAYGGGEYRPAYGSETRPAYDATPYVQAPAPMQQIQPTETDDRMHAPIQVTMNQVGGTGKSYTAYMSDELIVGRDGRSCQIAIEGDGKISGRHMQLTYDGVNMMVTDCNSTNGTRLNGKLLPKNRPTVLNQQDVISLGTTSLKITWWVRR